MSEKFNLKNYQKINGDMHIDKRLEEARKDAPNVINEKQLDDYRSEEANVTIEKLLEKNRTGSEDETTERRLETHKPKFANAYRNDETYTGDMNKLEEQRLKNKPVENEKYSAASETPAKMRWWDGIKSKDGLKVASTEENIKIAARPRFEIEDPENLYDPTAKEEGLETMIDQDTDEGLGFDVNDITNNQPTSTVEIVGSPVFLPTKEDPKFVTLTLTFDPTNPPDDIKEAALEAVQTSSELSGLGSKLTVDNFRITKPGTVKMVAGAELMEGVGNNEEAGIKGGSENLHEKTFEISSETGEPIASGSASITSLDDAGKPNIDAITLINEATMLFKKNHPELRNVPDEELKQSIQIEDDQVNFMIALPENQDLITSNSDFDIVVLAESNIADSKKK